VISAKRLREVMILCWLGLALSSCAPGAGGPAGSSARTASGSEQAGPKTLRIAMQSQAEPTNGLAEMTGFGNISGSADLEHRLTFHAGLTVFDASSVLEPRAAFNVPSLHDGTWQTFPDGRMELTWKLRPNAVWHDGTPLKASDFIFGTEVARDPEAIGTPPALGTKLLSEMLAPDDHTFVVRFPQPYVYANLGHNTPPLPAHHLREAYQRGDRQAFENHAYWTSEFIGLGPYKLSRWERGSFIEGLANHEYFLGRPKVDRLLIRYFGDVNTMIAALLAGDLDVLPTGAQLDAGQLTVIREAWQADAKGTVLPMPKGTRNVFLQLRDSTLPWARDLRVRQALAHAIDRQLIVDTLQYGITTAAYTSITPELEAFKLLEQRGLPRYEYDPARAERLLAEAGWVKGSDGQVRNSAGQSFTINVTSTAQGDNVKEAETIAAQWVAVGLQSGPAPIAANAANRDELKNVYQGAFIWPGGNLATALDSFTTSSIPTERTRWKGNNYSAYSNPTYDRLYEEFGVTLEPARSQQLVAEMMKIVADDVSVIPIYYAALGLAHRKGIEGPGPVSPGQAANAWNIHTWDVKS
jgi:peptide/nickel transport system substrate-binding protein